MLRAESLRGRLPRSRAILRHGRVLPARAPVPVRVGLPCAAGLRGSRGDVCLQLCSCSAGRWCRRGAGSAAKDLENFETSLRRQCLMASGAEQYAATKLRFVCLSDTHMRHASIRVPDGDVLVHTGDFTNHGTLKQTLEFADWFASQPHKVKICVPGNHDMIMDKDYWREFWSDWTGPRSRGSHSEAMDAFKDRGIHVLIDRALYLEVLPNGGGVKVINENDASALENDNLCVFGSPWVTRYASWQTAFNKLDKDMEEHWQRVVRGNQRIDLLLTTCLRRYW